MRTYHWVAVTAVVVSLLVAGGDALAGKGGNGGGGKPGGGGGGGGGGGSNAPLVLVYTKAANSGQDIKLASADGSNVTTLLSGVSGGGGVVEACWSPDGAEVAFTGTWSGTTGLHIVDVATAAVRTASTGSYFYHPSWSPDGALIAYNAPNGNRDDIYLYDVAADSVRNLTSTSTVGEENPAWSPDGTRLAVQYMVSGGNDVAILDLNADRTAVTGVTSLVDVPNSPFDGMVLEFPRPDWSRDGSYVAVGARVLGARGDLFRIAVSDPTDVVNLTQSKKATEHRPAWSPTADGKIAYRSGARSGSVVVQDLATGDTKTIDSGGANWPDWAR